MSIQPTSVATSLPSTITRCSRQRHRLLNSRLVLSTLAVLLTRCEWQAGKTGELDDIAVKLQLVREANRSNHHRPMQVDTGDVDFKVLIGMPAEDILDVLGAPMSTTWCLSSRCERGTPWSYHFYHLPDFFTGGGEELLVYFDESWVCVDIDRIHTQ